MLTLLPTPCYYLINMTPFNFLFSTTKPFLKGFAEIALWLNTFLASMNFALTCLIVTSWLRCLTTKCATMIQHNQVCGSITTKVCDLQYGKHMHVKIKGKSKPGHHKNKQRIFLD